MDPRTIRLLLGLSVFASALSVATPAAAQEPDPVAGWVTDPLFNVVQNLAIEHRIELIPDEGDVWTRADVLALREGARAIPEAIIESLSEPVRIRRIKRECLFGVGRFTKGCPAFDSDGNLLLYDLPPVQGEGPVLRLAPLTESERFDIQRRRNAVFALMLAFDRAERWSRTDRWRAINGWRTGNQPFNRDLWGYSRYLGYRSPRLDLVTFAEEWFVRPIDVVAPDRRDAIDPDMSVQCQEFTKSRFLAEKIALLDPTWHPPPR